jgi:microsomal epoxide hydrolase
MVTTMTHTPYKIEVPGAEIADLKARLAGTRWPDEIAGSGWDYGVDLGYMKELVDYWRDGFDWRAQECALNRFPQFKAAIDGLDIHFIHVRGKGPSPKPLLLTHGWPSSIAEFTKIIPLLSDPASHGADPADAFDLIVPSMPGYGFSSRPTKPGGTSLSVAPIWAKLMTELGYAKFFAQGGDIGAGVTNALGRFHGDRVPAIHTMATPYPYPTDENDPTLSAAERAYLVLTKKWEWDEDAYGHLQRTKPQTLAVGLNDSPAGLATWIVEKWRAWSDCSGDVETRFTKDELLTNVSIYWFTQTIGSSVRMYYESAHNDRPKPAKIETPTRLFLTREEVDRCPPEWAARSYANLSYGLAPTGGHFLAAEEPELLANDIRTYFRAFR